jgi:predicted DCC family thiol-disulfide oxidoreductase YuxK
LIKEKKILFYDGDCALCNYCVQYVITHEKEGNDLLFCSLQSDFAKRELTKYKYDFTQTNTLVLMEGDKVYYKSTAALNLNKLLKAPHSWYIALKIFPRFLRDWVYDIIARKRKKWFKKEFCFVPDDKLKGRFIK